MIVRARVAPKRDTTENWELHADFVPFCGELVIYTDKEVYTDDQGELVYVPGIKIGDGATAVGDLPFISGGGGGGGGGGVSRYDQLEGLPKMNGVTIRGNITMEGLAAYGIQKFGDYADTPLTDDKIDIITGFARSAEVLDELLEVGGEIELCNNIELSGQKHLVTDITINMNGCELSSDLQEEDHEPIFIVDGCRLTLYGYGSVDAAYSVARVINGGVIEIDGCDMDSEDVCITTVGDSSMVIFNDGYVTSMRGCVTLQEGASLYINGGTLEAYDGIPVFTDKASGNGGNNIVLNGGTLVSLAQTDGYEACGIYIANNDTFSMYGGNIIGSNGAGLCMRAGFVDISGGIIQSLGDPETTGWIDDREFAMGKSAVIYHELADYPGKEGMELNITGGTFIGVDHSLEILSDEETPNVSVTGGSFTPEYPEPEE